MRDSALEAGFRRFRDTTQDFQLDGCIVWNANNTVLGEEALLIYIVPVCYVKQVGMERPRGKQFVISCFSA